MRWELRRAASKLRRDGITDLLRTGTRHLFENSTAVSPYHRLTNVAYTLRNGRADPVSSRDWDNLIVLDACRYDAFESESHLQGVLEKRISVGSNTNQFFKHNFSGRELFDTVYVTANPTAIGIIKQQDPIFHDMVTVLDGYLSPTIHPDDVTDAAIDALEKHEDKRLIVHYLQPHAPFLGDTAEQLREELGEPVQPIHYSDERFTRNDLWKAYIETLDITLESVERLLSECSGKTVVTADHGELFREKIGPFGPKLNGHPQKLKCRNLREVPWFVQNRGERLSPVSEPPVERETPEQEKIQEHMEHLGYL
jgi:hypothetical protein